MSESGNAQGAIPGSSAQNGAAQGAGNQNPSNQNQNQTEYVSKADFDAAMGKLDAVLKDNANYRKRLREVSKASGSSSDSNGDSSSDNADSNAMSEVTTLKNKLRVSNFRNAITSAANKANSIVADDLYRLLDIDDYADDDGNVKNPDAIMEDLKKSNPNWFGTAKAPASINGGEGSNGNGGTFNMNDEIRAAARRNRVGR